MSRAQIVFQLSDRSGLVSSLRPLRLCLKSLTAQALSQVSDSSGRVTSLRSCFDLKLRFAALRSVMRRSEGWYLYRESSASCILAISSITYEIRYIQLIHWRDFRFTFWQVIESERSLLAHELCPRIFLSLKSDLWPKAASLRLLTRLLTRPLTFDLWLLISDLRPRQTATFDLTSDLTFDLGPPTFDFLLNLWPNFWLLANDFRPLTSDLRPPTCHFFTQPLIRDLWSPAFN